MRDDAALARRGNFCATQCVDCTEWSWWTPAPFGGGGTGGKTEKVRTEESMHEEREEREPKLLPVLNNISRPAAAPEAHDDRSRAVRARSRAARSHGADLKRFRRFHRLGEPCLLFVGPYTPDGGLDVAIEATHRLKETFADVRLAAIPSGPIDQKYLDACEISALGLGHRGIIEWTVDDAELPFWYATATAVCAPWRAPVGDANAARRAAAAGRPFIGSDVAPFSSELAGDADWATLVPAGDSGALVATATALFEVAVAAKAEAIAAAKARIAQARTRPELSVEPAQALPTQ